MKKLNFRFILSLLLLTIMVSASAIKREHRAVWMSAFTGDWPKSAITTSTAPGQKRICDNMMDTLAKSNMTTVYYHARVHCDATYNSAYEPWSALVSGTRGVAPAFDPFEYLLESAHSRGLEVYAWLNPYRYVNSTWYSNYGKGELNYENSHPEWLIEWQNGEQTWTIMNPALPEVKQRILDVVIDICNKYDIDGIVFDDYFYQSGLPASYDAEWYNAYKAAGGTLSQGDWRRENINDMVRKVNNWLKANKPWVRFGIGPAGVACGTNLPNVAAKYGIDPCPGSDWQYNSINSDPIAWYNEGSIDFMSPQVYWPIGKDGSDYGLIAPWWYKMADKFNRHAYISQDISSNSALDVTEFQNEVELNRTSDTKDAPGYVFFPAKETFNKVKRVDNKNINMYNYLRYTTFSTKVLTPVVTWIQTTCPGQVSNVTRSGRNITWNGPDNVRYTIYAVPKDIAMSSFHKEAEYLRAVVYTKSYEIPAYNAKYPEFGIADDQLENYNYAVCVYDRYGNEYSAVFEGATLVESTKPVITYPTAGVMTSGVFNFKWTGKANTYEIAIATDAAMKNTLVKKEVAGTSVASYDVYEFEENKQYYCTITARENNATEKTSDPVGFTVDVFSITSPADDATGCADNVTITWKETAGAKAHLVVASDEALTDVVYETDETKTSHTVPPYTLMGNCTYYAQVKAGNIASKIVSFTVKDMNPGVPTFLNPATAGTTIHCDESLKIAPARGIKQTYVQIAANTSFSARSSQNWTLTDFVFDTQTLENAKVSSKALVDGTTYYARARYDYYNEAGKSVNGEYCEPVSFIYSEVSGGIQVIGVDGINYIDSKLMAGKAGLNVSIYAANGQLVAEGVTDADGNYDVEKLPAGTYVAVINADGKTKTLKFIR